MIKRLSSLSFFLNKNRRNIFPEHIHPFIDSETFKALGYDPKPNRYMITMVESNES